MEMHIKQKGKLKIFFGICGGVGKTYSMINAARQAKREGADVVVGYINTIQSFETIQLLEGLESIAKLTLKYERIEYEEMSLDAILLRKPEIVMVDDLAHTNMPGSKYKNRCQEILKILSNGIDVYTTLNVINLESHKSKILELTDLKITDLVPDSILKNADEIVFIDISPDDLLKRLANRKILMPDIEPLAMYSLYRKETLLALHEILGKYKMMFADKYIYCNQ